MEYNKCSKCNTYHFDNKSCRDDYIIYHDDYLGEEGKIIKGYTFYEAAQNYGNYYNDEGQLIDNNIIVEIEDKKGIRKKFSIVAEISVQYLVEEIE